ncbi:MAG: AAA family ATPase [Bacteroidales bacterium]|jgi:exodeoxyribonuclease-5|nr:AAA family ATPase [Bacteroidales bacterium]
MIKNHLHTELLSELNFTPTVGQSELAGEVADFLHAADGRAVMLVCGYAGTGKTTMMRAVVNVLSRYGCAIQLMAPTGRAAKVLAAYTGRAAYTIHKRIYRQQSTTDGMGRFTLNFNATANGLFIVDEASMIANDGNDSSIFGSGRLLDDLISFVYGGCNCRLMLVGDTAQLPPVGSTLSPALNARELQQYGLTVFSYELTEVVRQQHASGILHNATSVRQLITGNAISYHLRFQLENFSDIVRLNGADLIETLSQCYDRYGEQQTVVVTRSNKRANIFNRGIRSSILYKDAEITVGDLLMVVKNNYFWPLEDERAGFIANGDIVRICGIRRYEELYGFRFADVSLQFVDYDDIEIDCKIFLGTLDIESANFDRDTLLRLFFAVEEDYADIRDRRKRWEKVRNNPHFNALQVKFAYAVTCHKAQGGQWDAVFVDQGYLTDEMLDREFLRWLYTALTRPTRELYLVNFNKEFF